MYKRVYGYGVPSFTFYFLNTPIILTNYIFYLIKFKKFGKANENILAYFENLRILNEVRKTCNYYTEKDNQARNTLIVKYKVEKACIYIKYKFEKKAIETTYAQFRETLQQSTSCKISEIISEKGYAHFYIILNFIPIYKYNSDRSSVTIGTGVNGLLAWDWLSYPHALIVGETGQGKSVFVRYLLIGLFGYGHEVWCIDGKVIDYAKYVKRFMYYEANAKDKKNLISLIRKFNDEMHERYIEMQEMQIDDYLECEYYQPKFLLIDEYLVLIEQCNKAEKEEIENLVKDTVLLGRACGYILIITMQRADAKVIGGNVRDNFMFRIVLGKASKESYKMMFQEDLKGFKKGKAWYSIGTDLDIVAIPFYKSIPKKGLE